jgi:hypothetical protein
MNVEWGYVEVLILVQQKQEIPNVIKDLALRIIIVVNVNQKLSMQVTELVMPLLVNR